MQHAVVIIVISKITDVGIIGFCHFDCNVFLRTLEMK